MVHRIETRLVNAPSFTKEWIAAQFLKNQRKLVVQEEVIRFDANSITLGLDLSPGDLIHDNLILQILIPSSELLQFSIDGRLVHPTRTDDLSILEDGGSWRLCEYEIRLKKHTLEYLDRAVQIRINLPRSKKSTILMPNRIGKGRLRPDFISNSVFSTRKAIYYLQFPAIFMIILFTLTASDVPWLSFPQSIVASAAPAMLVLFGDRYEVFFSRSAIIKYFYSFQLRHTTLSVLILSLVLLSLFYQYDKIRCNWIEYRYRTAYNELRNASTNLVDPVEELAKLASISPERRENLILFQHLLWRVRFDDAFAKIIAGDAQGFQRPEIAKRFLARLSPWILKKLENGEIASCGCVQPSSADDPRFLYIFSQEESWATITSNKLDDIRSLINFLTKISSNSGNSEFEALLLRYRIVYLSHIPTQNGTDHLNALREAQDFIDSPKRLRHSFLEILADQIAESHFSGYCNVAVGIDGYRRVLRIRDFNNESSIFREFPPEKLSSFRIISVLQGDRDFFNDQFRQQLSQVCTPKGETLLTLFKTALYTHWEKRELLKRARWRNNSPADPQIFEKLSKTITKGWR